MKKTLQNIVYGTLIIALGSFLSMKNVDGQISRVKNLTMKEADKEIDKVQNIGFEKPNTLYFVLQPGDLGLGLRYDRRIPLNIAHRKINRVGLYTSFSRGNYRFGEGNYINNHIKIAIGGKLYSKKLDFWGNQGFFTGGLSYHTYGERGYEPGTINEKGLNHFSGEFGAGANMERFSGALTFDPFKFEGSWTFGIKF